MLYDGTIEVAASPDEVMRLFSDVPRMAALIPGASIDGQDDDGAWRGTIVVAFGPKRIRFNGKVSIDFDVAAHSGTMLGRGVGDVRGAKVESKMTFFVAESPDSTAETASSTVSLHSDIALGGVLAEFARTGGPIVANALLKEFSVRLAAELAQSGSMESDAAAAPRNIAAQAPDSQPAPPAAPVSALRADRLAWKLFTHMLKQGWQRFLLIFRTGNRSH